MKTKTKMYSIEAGVVKRVSSAIDRYLAGEENIYLTRIINSYCIDRYFVPHSGEQDREVIEFRNGSIDLYYSRNGELEGWGT